MNGIGGTTVTKVTIVIDPRRTIFQRARFRVASLLHRLARFISP